MPNNTQRRGFAIPVAILVILANLVADLLYVALDPRVEGSGARNHRGSYGRRGR